MKPLTVLALVVAVLPAETSHRGLANDDLHKKVLETIDRFTKTDSGVSKFFDGAAGYAVFPSVAKGAIGVGGAHGSGELLVGGRAIGKCKLTQVTIGLQLGGQAYSEIIFFEQANTLEGFQNGNFAFAAQASAVAVTAGAAANAAYRNGVAVFTQAKGGLMYEASIGGQKFSYESYSKSDDKKAD